MPRRDVKTVNVAIRAGPHGIGVPGANRPLARADARWVGPPTARLRDSVFGRLSSAAAGHPRRSGSAQSKPFDRPSPATISNNQVRPVTPSVRNAIAGSRNGGYGKRVSSAVRDAFLRGRQIVDAGKVVGAPTGRYQHRPTFR
jgi:hypothetical protein